MIIKRPMPPSSRKRGRHGSFRRTISIRRSSRKFLKRFSPNPNSSARALRQQSASGIPMPRKGWRTSPKILAEKHHERDDEPREPTARSADDRRDSLHRHRRYWYERQRRRDAQSWLSGKGLGLRREL